MAVLKQLFQDRIDLISGNASDRKHRDPVFFINAQNDVSAANIIDIIGERTNGTKDRRRVKTSFEFHTIGLNNPLIDQILHIDWDCHDCTSPY